MNIAESSQDIMKKSDDSFIGALVYKPGIEKKSAAPHSLHSSTSTHLPPLLVKPRGHVSAAIFQSAQQKRAVKF